MNAPVAPGPSQTVQEAMEQARQNAVQTAEQVANAKTLPQAEAALATIMSLSESGGLQGPDFRRLKDSAETRVLSFRLETLGRRVADELAKAVTSHEARQLEGLVNEAPIPDERKRALIRQVLERAGELEIGEAPTIGLVKRFKKSFGARYGLHDPAATEELASRLESLAKDRISALRWARFASTVATTVLLAAGPLLVWKTQLPVKRTEFIPATLFSDAGMLVYSTHDFKGVLWLSFVHHPVMMAMVPLFIAVVVCTSRVHWGIAWIQVIRKNCLAKLFAITALAWLFSVILTHP